MNRKRSSKTVETAQLRIAGLKSINTDLDLGDGLSVSALVELVEATRTSLESYNTAMATIAQTAETIRSQEQAIATLSRRIMFGVAAKYGTTSETYRNLVVRRSRPRVSRSPEPTTASA